MKSQRAPIQLWKGHGEYSRCDRSGQPIHRSTMRYHRCSRLSRKNDQLCACRPNPSSGAPIERPHVLRIRHLSSFSAWQPGSARLFKPPPPLPPPSSVFSEENEAAGGELCHVQSVYSTCREVHSTCREFFSHSCKVVPHKTRAGRRENMCVRETGCDALLSCSFSSLSGERGRPMRDVAIPSSFFFFGSADRLGYGSGSRRHRHHLAPP